MSGLRDGFQIRKCSMLDMHAHLKAGEEELRFRAEHGIFTVFSAGNRKEWEELKPFGNNPLVWRSFGVHPWYADTCHYETMMDAFWEADYIGEIGLDNVWCETDLHVQEREFLKQLEIAADLKKPVLLHTKGMEKRIAEMIADFPEAICVHWYSGTENDLEAYLKKNCYFTLGPDTSFVSDSEDRRSRERIINEVPLDHLFTETDGLDAIAWAKEHEMAELPEIRDSMEITIRYLAKRKECPIEAMKQQLKENLLNFMKKQVMIGHDLFENT